MNLAQIRRIVDELAGSAASEVRVETDEMKLHLRFTQSGGDSIPALTGDIPALTGDSETIAAPMPGMVYFSPAPDAPPFVTVGARVAAGDTVLLIEAMKSMLPVRASCDSIVEELLVADESLVDISQPLIRLCPVTA